MDVKEFDHSNGQVEFKTWELEDGHIGIRRLLTILGLVPCNGESRRLISRGAVKINGEKVEDVNALIKVEDNMIVHVGKHRFVQIKEMDSKTEGENKQ